MINKFKIKLLKQKMNKKCEGQRGSSTSNVVDVDGFVRL